MGRFPTSLLCASALLLGAVACSDDDQPSASEEPSPTTSTTAPAPGRAGPTNVAEAVGRLESGRYFIDPDGDPATSMRVTYEIPEGGGEWGQWIGAARITDGPHTMLSITTITNVVRDGCTDHVPLDPPVGPTVENLATALSELAPFEVTAPPTDVMLFGYQGKHLELTVPKEGIAGCDSDELHSWVAPPLGGAFFGYNGPEPGLTEEFWILDVDGTRLVLVTNTSPDAPTEWIAERQAIIDSIRVVPAIEA